MPNASLLTHLTADLADLQAGSTAFAPALVPRETGAVLSVAAGVVRVSGLPGAGSGELLRFAGGLHGLAYNLDETEIGVILLGEDARLRVFRLRPEGVADLRAWLDRLEADWNAQLESFQRHMKGRPQSDR